ncbi:type II toxin-antitoxin system HicA family toxin [Flavonifractor hominis]|uniref:Type II toxin-antitoxin system HicA family toxin n=1 Tax=Flavonifractor hominis TaxID=3133178 RepID=A0ABV1EK50_9FIRM
MKRRDLIKLLERNGWQLFRNGGNHDVYIKDGEIEVIPRHNEIKEMLAKAIIRKHGLK